MEYEDGMRVIDRSVDRSMDIGEQSKPWPFWKYHSHDTWFMKIILCIPMICSWFLWKIKGGNDETKIKCKG